MIDTRTNILGAADDLRRLMADPNAHFCTHTREQIGKIFVKLATASLPECRGLRMVTQNRPREYTPQISNLNT